MKPRFRLSALRTRTKALLGIAVALAVLLMLFDWNWFRPPLERYLSEKSKREVRIGDLHVRLGFNPTVRVRDVYIQNAPWADKAPLIVAGEARFTVSLRSLWDERTVISRIVLLDAEVDLEKQADGLRNWRLVDPDYRGPRRIDVLALEAQRTKIRFLDRGLDLDVVTAASTLAPDKAGRVGDHQVSTRLDFNGTFRKAKFSGAALTGELVTFRKTEKPFPLLGHVLAGRTRVDVEGIVADAWDPSLIDAKVRIAGPSLASLYPFLLLSLPASRPYVLEGQLTQSETEYTFARFRGKIGDSDIAGDGSYSRNTERPLLRATLRSETVDVADLGQMIGASRPSEGAVPAPAGVSTEAKKAPSRRSAGRPLDAGRILPAKAFDLERLRAIDARVTLEAKTLKAREMLALESLRFTAELDDGVLQLKPVDFGLAGGHVVGLITVNARGQPMSSRATVDFRNIKLDKLFRETPAMARSAGTIGAQLKLTGRGDSIASLLASSSGTFAATMDGGRMSNLADAKLGLNGGKILALMLSGDRDIAIRCGALAFDFHNGLGQSRILLLDTEETRTDGTGTIDLRAEKFDFVLRPKPKKPGIFSLRAPIQIQGTFKHADVSVDKVVVLGRAGGAAVLAAINPLALFVPLIETGPGKDSPCAEILGSMPAATSNAAPRPEQKSAPARAAVRPRSAPDR